MNATVMSLRDVALARRLIVVLERCTIVHALETLELLRTLETAPNPRVRFWRKAVLRLHSACRTGRPREMRWLL